MTSISVIVPCYNVESYIEEGLRSVLQQTYSAREIICVDDGSQDKTITIIRKLQDEFPNKIFLYLNEKNRGATYTRNRGLAISRGDYIQFFDADDILMPNKFEKQVAFLEAAAEKPDIIANDFKKKLLDGSEVTFRFTKKDPWCALMEGMLGITTSNLFRRETVIAVGGWSENLLSSQEYDLMFRMMAAGGTVRFNDEILSMNRERISGSITKSDPSGRWRRFIDLRERIFRFLTEKGMKNEEREDHFINIMFDGIRVLYKYDRKEAIKLHRQYIKKDKRLKPTGFTSARYLNVYRLLGFRAAELASRLLNPPNGKTD